MCGNCSYHDNAFVASRPLHIVNKLNPSATFDLLEGFFESQVRISFVYGMTMHFVASHPLHIVNKLNPSATFDLLEGFFESQFRIYFVYGIYYSNGKG